jgi:hypothetical protein
VVLFVLCGVTVGHFETTAEPTSQTARDCEYMIFSGYSLLCVPGIMYDTRVGMRYPVGTLQNESVLNIDRLP